MKESDARTKQTAVVAKVIDGDTLDLKDGRRIRLANVNTPEKKEEGYNLAKRYLEKLENKTVQLEFLGDGGYSRNLSRVYYNGYVNLNLVKLGYAKKFLVQEKEKRDFSQAESEAISKSLGIWKKSPLYGCINARIDEKNEIIFLSSVCSNISLSKITIADESRKKFTLEDLALGRIEIHSGNGESKPNKRFLNSNSDIWNNDCDTLYLYDSTGRIILTKPYGY